MVTVLCGIFLPLRASIHRWSMLALNGVWKEQVPPVLSLLEHCASPHLEKSSEQPLLDNPTFRSWQPSEKKQVTQAAELIHLN